MRFGITLVLVFFSNRQKLHIEIAYFCHFANTMQCTHNVTKYDTFKLICLQLLILPN